MAFLISIGILILSFFVLFILVKVKMKKFMMKYFSTTDLKSILDQEKILDEEIPKSLSSLDNLYLEQINKDFPNLNINELKSEVEKIILESYHAIENKSLKNINIKNAKVKQYIKSKIADAKKDNISYKNIKIHKTVISKYENKKEVSTIYFQTAFQYQYKENDYSYRLKQDRITTEYIYVIDEEKLSKNIKAIGLNCPNCGAPIKRINHKVCTYCGSGILDLVKKTFIINNIENK